ncbi:MAG TPA: hypothetical protein DEB32_01860 [Stenotrophomonas sp.]|jgi:hypothetical protein|uniref:hypothetical protein n=1 Tax=Stenotrophomonas TaxID=40323 RepID=UPI0003627EEE|nr:MULTISPECIES: hypothetical protein [Stenotrophomonas]QIO89109.1 hypothetical protein G9274_002794 [Stenotrophomonas rhizophila]HBS61484.1 hypothetical protein [Stenotrophomonas sp.]
MRTLALLEGGCALCGHVFAHPALGDHAYGEALLCSADGHHVVVASAFDPVPQRVAALLPAGADARFWPVLAALADPIGGQPLVHGLRCPQCGGAQLRYHDGHRRGTQAVANAGFVAATALTDLDLQAAIEHHLAA